MWLKIEPFDVFLFREAKPFTAGDNFHARSLFPPTPLPLVGALRSRIFTGLGVDFAAYKTGCRQKENNQPITDPELKNILEQYGSHEDLGNLSFMGPFLGDPEGDLLFSAPRDLVRNSDNKPVRLRPEQADSIGKITCKKPTLLQASLSGSDEGLASSAGYFIKGKDLRAYIANTPLALSHLSAREEVVADEARTGLTMNNKRTAATGLLYFVEYNRLQTGFSFLVQMRGFPKDTAGPLPKSGLLSLGGKSRPAAYDLLAEESYSLPDCPDLAGKSRFKLVLVAPAIFHQGWLPDGVRRDQEGNSYFFRIDDIRCTLVSALTDKPLPIGGWNLVKNRPRTMRQAVPAGGVYFFETDQPLTDSAAKKLQESCHLQCLMNNKSNLPPLYRQAGFGIGMVGLW